MRAEAIEAMTPYLDGMYANPSGSHRFAREARKALDEARDLVAATLGLNPVKWCSPVAELRAITTQFLALCAVLVEWQYAQQRNIMQYCIVLNMYTVLLFA